jgi:precorrin-3B C17-methyltransferase
MSTRGRLSVIGLGPGDARYLTAEASEALFAAQDIIGYAPYVARVPVTPGQTRIASDNRVEIERAEEALRLAASGRRVAVVSGGDPGIFAMAAAVLEAVDKGDPAWRDLDIDVLPGISAMQAAAARLGAPLGHDFCVLSLSDNLKPWDMIETRLELAARADLVMAFYNPASRARPQRIHDAFALLRRVLPADRIIVFAKSVGRTEEDIIVTTLGEADPSVVDMSTLVLVGASGTTLVPRRDARPFVYTSRKTR